jgi:hypothetical protein
VWQQLAKLLLGIIPRKYAANGEKFKQIGRERKGMLHVEDIIKSTEDNIDTEDKHDQGLL